MHAQLAHSRLETLLAEVLLADLVGPCDLGDGIEVVHDVEDDLQIEMDCDLDDHAADFVPGADDVFSKLARALCSSDEDELGTVEFVRYSAPYERIELQAESHAFVRPTIEEPKAPASLRGVVRASRVHASHVHVSFVRASHPRTVMRSMEADTAPFSPYEPIEILR